MLNANQATALNKHPAAHRLLPLAVCLTVILTLHGCATNPFANSLRSAKETIASLSSPSSRSAHLSPPPHKARNRDDVQPSLETILVQLQGAPALRQSIAAGTSLRQALAMAKDGLGPFELDRLQTQPIEAVSFRTSHDRANAYDVAENARRHVADFAHSQPWEEPSLARERFADDECLVLIRGNTRMFAPSTLVHETPLGRLPLKSGDVLASIPLELVRQGAIWGANGESRPVQIALSGPFCETRSLEVPNKVLMDNGWSDFFRAAELQDHEGNPNVVIVHRYADMWHDLLLSPVSKTFRDDDWEGTFRSELPHLLIDQDVLEITRLDYLPALLLSPRQSRATRVTTPRRSPSAG